MDLRELWINVKRAIGYEKDVFVLVKGKSDGRFQAWPQDEVTRFYGEDVEGNARFFCLEGGGAQIQPGDLVSYTTRQGDSQFWDDQRTYDCPRNLKLANFASERVRK